MSQQTELQQSPTKVTDNVADPAQTENLPLDSNNENYQKILNLSYFGDALRDPSKKKELANRYKDLKTQQKLDNAPDFEAITEFYGNIFGYKGERKYQPFKTAMSKASTDLFNYTSGSDQSAGKNVTYKQISDAIEKMISLDILHSDDSKSSTRQIKNMLFKEAMTKPKTTSQEFIPSHQNLSPAKEFSLPDTTTNTTTTTNNTTTTTSSGEHPHHAISVKSPEFRPHTDDAALSYIKLDNDGFIEVQPRYALSKKGEHQHEHVQPAKQQKRGGAKKQQTHPQQQQQHTQQQHNTQHYQHQQGQQVHFNQNQMTPSKKLKQPAEKKLKSPAQENKLTTPIKKQTMTPTSTKKQLSQKSPMAQHISPRGQTLRSPKALQNITENENIFKPNVQPAHPPSQVKETAKTPKSTKRKWSHASPVVSKEYVRKELPLETPAPTQSSQA